MRILLDTNILIHAYNSTSGHHTAAKNVMAQALNGEIEAVLASQILCEFYSVSTDRRRIDPSLDPVEASRICRDLYEALEIIQLSCDAVPLSLELAGKLHLRGPTVFDCLIAVAARENDVSQIYTENTRDFERYDFLEAINPLIS